MQPVRPKMKKVLLTGFVACMSLFGLSSGAPVPRTTRPAEPTAASLPVSSSPTPNQNTNPRSTASSSPSTTTANSSPSSRTHGASATSTAPSVNPPRPSSFSLGLNLGQIDYAAAGLARRVSRIFVKRMSAQSSRSTQSAQSANIQGRGDEVEDKEKEKEKERVTLLPVVEHESNSFEESRPVVVHVDGDADSPDVDLGESGVSPVSGSGSREMVAPDIRACRWGCI
ncbi:hypothetical protein J3R30DRAFT_3410415 [Lentinula aciculospora]|uniref:Uncharacterized protein n=1 Tax=Lentinula aciculospora TaxID=153920 RepID=A0A9W9DFT5_9AGAR|nr:hypothetical protein J3R30DRAFT_3410415 [Lentinula aciculospora]